MTPLCDSPSPTNWLAAKIQASGGFRNGAAAAHQLMEQLWSSEEFLSLSYNETQLPVMISLCESNTLPLTRQMTAYLKNGTQ